MDIQSEIDALQNLRKRIDEHRDPPAEDNEHILKAFLAMMSEGIERAINNGWIEKDATDERKIVSGIIYIVAHEMGNVSYRGGGNENHNRNRGERIVRSD